MAALTAGGLESTADLAHRASRFDTFNGLRAIAAFAIVLTHVGYASGATFRDPMGPYLARMESGVSIFFVISGFLLYRPYVRAHLDNDRGPRMRAFLWRRALRIFPAYWFALTFIWLVLDSVQVNTLADALSYYFLLQIYDPLRFLGGITQAWSLATELTYYAFLPLYAALLRPRAWRSASRQRLVELGGVAALFAISGSFRLWLYAESGALASRAWAWLPANLDLFGFGMLLAVVLAAAERGGAGERLAAAIPPAWVCWLAAAAAFWTAAIPLGLPQDFTGQVSTQQHLARQLLYGLTGFFLVLPAALAPGRMGAIGSVLRSWPFAFLGAISYGVYLWHLDIVGEVVPLLGGEMLDSPFWPVLGAAVVLSIIAAAASYHLIERPALRLKNLLR